MCSGVTSASALVRQLCHLNWRDGELVLLLAMLITKTNPVCKFLLIQFGIFSAESSSQQTKISQNFLSENNYNVPPNCHRIIQKTIYDQK